MWQSLPVELKTEILKLCSGSDKINFGKASGDRILISNKDIWIEVTLYHHSEFAKCQKYLGAHTRRLTFIGQEDCVTEISESLLNSICQHCPSLEDMTLQENIELYLGVIQFSMFPKTINILRLININISILRDSSGTTPFSRIKKELPLLEKLHLCKLWFLVPYDLRAIIFDNQVVPQLEIEGDNYYYTMIHVKDERVSGFDEEERQRQIEKLYNEVIAPHHYKRLQLGTEERQRQIDRLCKMYHKRLGHAS